MYVLLIILSLNYSGKALTSQSIPFATKALCEEAKSEVTGSSVIYSADKTTVLCLKAK